MAHKTLSSLTEALSTDTGDFLYSVVGGNSRKIRPTNFMPVFTGDGGAGGARGLVPAPAAGDAAANKFLKSSGSWYNITYVYLDNTGLKIKDTDASHWLTIAPGSNLSADRTLTVTTGDSARTLDISAADVTVSSYGATLIDDANAATARATLSLGTSATQNTGTSGANIPLLNVANTWSAAQSISSGNANGLSVSTTRVDGASVTVTTTEDGASAGPYIDFYRTSTSPDVSDSLAIIRYIGRNSSGTPIAYANTYGVIVSPTASAEIGRIVFQTYSGGSLVTPLQIGPGLQVGSPTGGDKGIGTINAVGVYDDNSLLTCYVLEAERTGTIDLDRWDGMVLDREYPETRYWQDVTEEVEVSRTSLIAQSDGSYVSETVVAKQRDPVKVWTPIYDADGNGIDAVEEVIREEIVTPARTEVRRHEPARRFLDRIDELDPEKFSAKWKAAGVLPGFPTPDEWAVGSLSTGDIVQRLWELCELQAVHIDRLSTRISALEKRA